MAPWPPSCPASIVLQATFLWIGTCCDGTHGTKHQLESDCSFGSCPAMKAWLENLVREAKPGFPSDFTKTQFSWMKKLGFPKFSTQIPFWWRLIEKKNNLILLFCKHPSKLFFWYPCYKTENWVWALSSKDADQRFIIHKNNQVFLKTWFCENQVLF